MLSDSALKKLHRKPIAKQMVLTDRDGLYCRVSKTGSISFFMRYQYKGRSDAVTLGKYPVMTLKQARDKNIELRAALIEGINPKIKKKIDIQANVSAMTFQELIDTWYEKEATYTIKHHVPVYAQFKNHLFPIIGALPAKDISTPMFFDVFESIKKKSATTILSLLPRTRKAYAFAIRRKILTSNPLIGITCKGDFHVTPSESERYLNDDEITRLLWCCDSPSNQYNKNIIMIYLALFFGCRIGELRSAKQAHFDFFNMTWTIPPENHKTGKKTKAPIIRPIIPEVKEKIETLMALSSNSVYLMTAKHTNEPPKGTFWAYLPERVNIWLQKNKHKPIPHWSIHDLRRTMRTHVGKMAEPHVCEIMLGHTLGGVWRTYDKGSYLDEQREAYQKWYNKLNRLQLGEANIVDLKNKRLEHIVSSL